MRRNVPSVLVSATLVLFAATIAVAAASSASGSGHRPSFAGKPSVTGLPRAEQVLTALGGMHPQASGLATALAQVTANAAAHATGHP